MGLLKLVILPPVPQERRDGAAVMDPNEQRCLIENRLKDTTVQLAHVFDRGYTADDRKIDGIEWCWGLRRGSLNLDTSRNIFFLDASVFKMYRKRKWVLVPEESIVDRYVNERGRPLIRPQMQTLKFDSEDTVYKYTFAPVLEMEDVLLTRQSTNNPSEVAIHSFPFDNMPTLISHVDPKFVILQTGSVLSCTFAPGTVPVAIKSSTLLEKIRRLYRFWVTKPPPCSQNYADYIVPSPHFESAPHEERIHNSAHSPRAFRDVPTTHQLEPCNSLGPPTTSDASVNSPKEQNVIIRPQTPPRRIQPLHDYRREWFASLEPIEIPDDGTMVYSEGSREPIRFSAGWSPDTIREWALNSYQASSTLTS
ncbi:hypothetical protein CVT24_012308 [Panaeolus cyanescens]|uniref:HNH nuclease domain-containing protein n=1 Tax=Panaeolus cyanescens TaxID=181874 RepID=A0A409WU79_9AGAR|nr:hypothetical protein CVT24_012308 [Panaeolus cyanescens]